MTPDYAISVGGLDITGRISSRLVELTVVDSTGVESDAADIVLLDPQAEIEPPRKGAELSIRMGYRESGLVDMGRFKVDQVGLDGYPHQIRISAKAADNKASLKERRSKDYTDKTLGQIASEVAGRHGLTARVAGALASIKFPTFARPEQSYVGQHEESDPAFLTRLAAQVGGFFTIKQGQLIIAVKGAGTSLSGSVGTVLITPDRLIDKNAYKVDYKDKPVHGKVEASYFDRKKVKREPVTAGSGDGVVFRFRQPFPDETQAKKAAEAKVRELERAEGSAKFEIWGDPGVRAEMQAIASGIRSGVDGTWPISRAEHHMSGDGPFTTKIECEQKAKSGQGNQSSGS